MGKVTVLIVGRLQVQVLPVTEVFPCRVYTTGLEKGRSLSRRKLMLQ